MNELDPAELEPGNVLNFWDAREYLEYYYAHRDVPDDEAEMFRFFVRGLADIGRHFEAGIELGCGPVLHRAAQVVPWVDRLDMADIQDENLEEIRRWLRGDPGAFDWSVYLGGDNGLLDIEGRRSSLAEREALMRARIRPVRCNLRTDQPLGTPVQYPLVSSYYSLEWVIPTMAGWQQTMRRATSLVAPGGWLLLAGVHATDHCIVNGQRGVCAHVTEVDLRRLLGELGFDVATLHITVTPGLRPEESGIQGTFMAYAQRCTDA
jgi:hypothetical protein